MLTNTHRWLLPLMRHAWVLHSARTALAATISLAAANLFSLPEGYWAPISTIIVMQSSLGASWDVSKQRLIGTVIGAVFASLLASLFAPRLIVFGCGVFVLGLICAVLHLSQSAYRFAGVAFAITVLLTRDESIWLIGLHRIVEVSLGIAAALVICAIGPDFTLPTVGSSGEGKAGVS